MYSAAVKAHDFVVVSWLLPAAVSFLASGDLSPSSWYGSSYSDSGSDLSELEIWSTSKGSSSRYSSALSFW